MMRLNKTNLIQIFTMYSTPYLRFSITIFHKLHEYYFANTHTIHTTEPFLDIRHSVKNKRELSALLITDGSRNALPWFTFCFKTFNGWFYALQFRYNSNHLNKRYYKNRWRFYSRYNEKSNIIDNNCVLKLFDLFDLICFSL